MDNAWCFALAESPVNGVVIKITPAHDLVKAVLCSWIEAGGPDALRRAKPNITDVIDDHWISISRNILKKYDAHIPGVGAVKIVTMHLRVFKIIDADLKVPIGVPVAETV